MAVLVELRYVDPAGRVWTVPAGFITDGASIPTPLWALIGSPFTGKYRIPALFHDAAYSTLGVTKDDADNMFHDAMLEAGCPEILAAAIYSGVRFGGIDPYAAAQRKAAATATPSAA